METVLYELQFRWGDLPVLLIPLLMGAGFWVVSCGVARANREKPAGKDLTSPVVRDLSRARSLKWFLRGVAVLCGVVFLLSGWSYMSDYAHLRARYREGDYVTVRGRVEELTTAAYPDKGGDSFTVEGVAFTYSDTDLTLPGYRKQARRGGCVTREGQYLIIRYIPDPDTGINHILYIAEKESPSS